MSDATRARRVGVTQLVGAWILYWIALLAVALHGGIAAVWRVTRPGGNGSMSAGFGDGAFTATVMQGGRTVWHAAAGMWPVALWLAVPPLVLWLLWLVVQRRPPVDAVAAPAAREALAEGARPTPPRPRERVAEPWRHDTPNAR